MRPSSRMSRTWGCLNTILTFFLLGIRETLAQTTPGSDVTSSTPPVQTTEPATPTILRPSDGETIMGGQPYTVSWTPPTAPGNLTVEMWGETGAFTYQERDGGPCDGYLVNTRCTKLWDDIPNAETWRMCLFLFFLISTENTGS